MFVYRTIGVLSNDGRLINALLLLRRLGRGRGFACLETGEESSTLRGGREEGCELLDVNKQKRKQRVSE